MMRRFAEVARPRAAALLSSFALLLHPLTAEAQETIDVGRTGFDVKRPVLASACPNGCPWGELGDFVVEAMAPYGYEVIQCRNCNRAHGPRVVAGRSYPPELTGEDLVVGTTVRVNATVDFGITSSNRLAQAFAGWHNYAEDGPFSNLRLIAKIEDPSYLLLAVKADSGITDLRQIAEQKLAVTILGGDSPISRPVLDYYGLTQEAVTSWGGSFMNATIAGFADDPAFDVLINENASPANNPEASYWTKLSQKHDLRYLDLPEPVLDQLANDPTLGVERAVVKWGFLRGVERPIPTVARSGHAVFARNDMPEQAGYDAAKAIDLHRAQLKWYIRPYSYDPRTAFENQGVPLHPGAERYYREVGYLPESQPRELRATGGGCAIRQGTAASGSIALLSFAIGVLALARRRRRVGLTLGFLLCLAPSPARAQGDTIDVGETGFAVKRPVLASACERGCPWGELGDFVTEAMRPLGYEVIQCRNCNRAEGPRIVAKASHPPELSAIDTFVGTTTRVNAPIDFGITESGFLAWAYAGRYVYGGDGPYQNLRLIAKIEDPTYLLVAVKADSGITDLSQIAEQRMPVKILAGDSPISERVLDHYGINREALGSWGGSIESALIAGALGTTDFQVIISELASPANNRESSYWTAYTHAYSLKFLDLPEALLDRIANTKDLGALRVVAKWGLLRGVDRPIPTVGRSGEAIFARDDTPETAAYDVAKAIDAHRSALRGYIRPYSYDPRTVAQNFDVPLHPGAERYYREVGYLSDPAAPSSRSSSDGGCSVDRSGRPASGIGLLVVVVLLVLGRLRRR